MTQPAESTEFAPVERAGPEALTGHRDILLASECRVFLDALPQPLFILNRQRQVVFTSAPTLALLGLSRLEDLVGQRPGEILRCINASEHAGGCGCSRHCRNCGAAMVLLSALEGQSGEEVCRIWRRDQAAIEGLDFRINAAPIVFRGHNLVLMTLTDITDELRRTNMERIFFHDVLNLAGGIAGMLGLVQDTAPEAAAKDLELIHNAAEALVEEIQSQRDLAAAETNELQIRLEPLDAPQLLELVQHLYARGHETGGQSVRIPHCSLSAPVLTDTRLVLRIVGNMVKNALEAGRPGDEVTVSCQEEGDSVVFRVQNPAVIPRDVQDSIFRRSFSTKGQGRGLGTYSMQLLAERYLKGSVGFTSTLDQGTTFFLRIPKDRGPETA